MHKLVLLPVLLIIAACAITPSSYTERVAAGYTAVAVTNDTAATLVIGGTITKEDGREVLKQTRSAREVLDAASALSGQVGEDKLQSALTLLRAAQDFLCKDRPEDPNCIAMRSQL